MNNKEKQILLNVWLKQESKTLLKVDSHIGPLTQYELMFYKYPHFRKEDFKCKCRKYCDGYPVKVDEQLLINLEKIRSKAGNVPIKINSAIRCKQHNKNVGGVYNSQHLLGTAADINISNLGSAKEYEIADKIVGSQGAVLRYITKNFVHIDGRGTRIRVTYK